MSRVSLIQKLFELYKIKDLSSEPKSQFQLDKNEKRTIDEEIDLIKEILGFKSENNSIDFDNVLIDFQGNFFNYLNFIDDIKPLEEINDLIVFKNIKIKKEDAYFLLNNFFKNFDKDFYSQYLNYYDFRKEGTLFTDRQDPSCYSFETFNTLYVVCEKLNSIPSFLGLVHEVTHFISNKLTNFIASNKYPLNFTEIESQFMEIAFADSLKQESDDSLKNELNKGLRDKYIEMTESIDDFNKKLEIMSDKGLEKNSFEDFVLYCQDKYNLSIEELDDLFSTSFQNDIKYPYSYLVAIELFYKYKKDPEEGAYLLKTIMKLDHINYLKAFLESENIHLYEHTNEYKSLILEK